MLKDFLLWIDYRKKLQMFHDFKQQGLASCLPYHWEVVVQGQSSSAPHKSHSGVQADDVPSFLVLTSHQEAQVCLWVLLLQSLESGI